MVDASGLRERVTVRAALAKDIGEVNGPTMVPDRRTSAGGAGSP